LTDSIAAAFNWENMEQRFGSRSGPFFGIYQGTIRQAEFRQLCPVSKTRSIRREYEELVTAVLCICQQLWNFEKSVDEFLNQYLDSQNSHPFDAGASGG